MEYVIKNTKGQYIQTTSDGKFMLVGNLSSATRYPADKARNILNNSFTVSERRKFKLLPATDESQESEPNNVLPKYSRDRMDNLCKMVDVVVEALKDNKDYIDELHTMLTQVEAQQTDLLHYIEFNTFNVVNGYNAYKMLHDILVTRRQLKNDIVKHQAIYTGVDELLKSNFHNRVAGLEERQYTPRALPQLFPDLRQENKETKSKESKKKG